MKRFALLISLIGSMLVAPIASAHVVVKPAQVPTGSFESFSVGVPNEKDIPTTSLRLVMPDGLQYVSAKLAPGWKVDITKTGTGEDAKVTEITWSGNEIPAGFRDDFVFSAKVPDSATDLTWKAYQTYQDGTVVAWDMKDNGKDEEGSTPASITKVVAKTPDTLNTDVKDSTARNVAALALIIGVLSGATGVYALLGRKK